VKEGVLYQVRTIVADSINLEDLHKQGGYLIRSTERDLMNMQRTGNARNVLASGF
jgi:hypothetical protein